ncbi:MAG TPA: hypothetical protein VNZ52_04100 [Candidatus Thermoplasmatota archaeon]|nr:hypothetical protein [Candidatus Thermoplasmatota archaeon]
MERDWELIALRAPPTPPSPWAEETLDYFGYYGYQELARIQELRTRLR